MTGDGSRREFIKKVAIATTGVAGISGSASAMLTGNDSRSAETSKPNGSLNYDVVVYGATSGGVIAAYTAKMYGLKVLLVEPGRHLGGLSSGGLGATDTGGKEEVIAGLARDFYTRVGMHYGDKPIFRFEPHVAESIFNAYINEAEVDVWYSRRVKRVKVKRSKIRRIELESSTDSSDVLSVVANHFIDTSYEGDLMAKAGVTYTIGRESNELYNEKFNGVCLSRLAGKYNGQVKRTSEWPVAIDPYVKPGSPSSGLLPEINDIEYKPDGTGDKSVQSYCFRLCLTQEKENQLPFYEPGNYNPDRYELLVRLLNKRPWKQLGKGNGFIISKMPNGKTDWNNYGLAGISSNYTGKSHEYPDADYAGRKRIWNDHIDYQQGLLWFIATDSRVPEHLRKEMNSWGYCRDEFLDTKGWPHQLYIREARRMVGEFIMTEHECVGHKPVADGVGYGAYALDSHTCNRIVVEGRVENEGNYFIKGFDPYAISYRSLLPKRDEITNLVVPVCLSASHAAFGSIRMEPVFMGLGQAAGIAVFQAQQKSKALHDLDASEIRNELDRIPQRE
ncbi:MAG TPA: FAD-dependent oxidoreductase [Anseongella sp.]